MKKMIFIFITALAVLSDACATRRKDSDTSDNGNKAPDAKADTPFVSARPLIDPKTLVTPKFTVNGMDSCKEPNARAEQVLIVEMELTAGSKIDYFEVQTCPKDSKRCQTVTFSTKDMVLSTPDAGLYEISVRSCLDSIHSTDTQNTCNDWSVPVEQAVAKAETRSALIAKEMELRTLQNQNCSDIRTVMAKYVGAADSSDPLRKMLEENLDAIGVTACTDMLLSNQLRAIEMIAQARLADMPSASPSTALVPYNSNQNALVPYNPPSQQNAQSTTNQSTQAAPQAPAPITITVKMGEEKKKDKLEGIMYMTLGFAGVAFSGSVIVDKVLGRTLSDKEKKINAEILQIEKKEAWLEYKVNEVEIKRLTIAKDEFNKPEGLDARQARLKNAEANYLLDILEKWKPWCDSTILVEGESELGVLINKSDRNALEKKMIEIHERVKADWRQKYPYLSYFRGPTSNIFAPNDYAFHSPYQSLLDSVEEHRQVKISIEEFLSTQSVDKSKTALLEANDERMKTLSERNAEIKASYLQRMKNIGTAAWDEGAKVASGGRNWGGRVGYALGFLFGVGRPLGDVGTVLGHTTGYTYGILAGTYDQFYAEFEDWREPNWTQGERERLALLDDADEQVRNTNRGTFQSEFTAKKATLKSSKGIFHKGYLRPDFEMLKERVTNKIEGLAPWFTVAAISAISVAYGTNQLSLADATSQTALKDFLSDYSKKYKYGEALQKEHSEVQLQINSGVCSVKP